MLQLMVISDVKAQVRLRSVGFMIYLATDDEAKETMKQAENEGTIKLEGVSYNEDRLELVQSYTDLIETEYSTEKNQRVVEMLSDIQTCNRKPREIPGVFFNRFTRCITMYIIHLTIKNYGEDQQWAIMLLRNAMISPDPLKDLIFKVTAGETIAKKKYPTITLAT